MRNNGGKTRHERISVGLTILLADGDAVQRERISDMLSFYGYGVKTVMDGRAALTTALCLTPDLIILDLMLPEMDGLEVCRQIRRIRSIATTPILMIATSGDEIDIVVSLEVGADAFLTKTVTHQELLARIDALLRRTAFLRPTELRALQRLPSSTEELIIGPLQIDVAGWRVTCRGKSFDMPRKEFELLLYLIRHAEMILPRDQILLDVWGKDYAGPERPVDVHVRKLRQKFERDPKTHRLIQTVHRVGYCFKPEEQMLKKERSC